MQFAVESSNGKTGEPVNTCTPILPTYGKDLRISFMVDSSGSTKDTDPNKYYRAQTLDNFIKTYGAKTNLTYNYGIFSAAFSYFNPSANSFSSSANIPYYSSSGLQSAINVYKSQAIASDGTTNYKQAFGGVKANIMADMAIAGSPKAYSVVFMSDGEPKDLSNPLDKSAYDIVNDLVLSVASGGGAVRVSGVYFGPSSNSAAIAVMKAVASAGHGQFIDTNVLPNNAIDIADAISIPGENCGQ